MNKGFWETLEKPCFVLAPMADVTDAAFRRVIANYGKPAVTWTEFVSADGLVREEAKPVLLRDLEYTEAERPIVAQIFSADPENMKQAAALVRDLGFDGIDLNMGCPDRNVCKQGAGCGMIKTPQLAQEVIHAAREGAGDLPVSVKTRAGWSSDRELDDWMTALFETQPVVLTLHARTRKDMSKVPARWELVKRAVELRDEQSPETLVFGNGDVVTLEDARRRARETGADGVMIGKGIFGNPWVFNEYEDASEKTPEEKLRVMVEHTKLFEEFLGDVKNFHIMKKHYKAYVTGWRGARELRARLMDTHNAAEVEEIVEEYLASPVCDREPVSVE